MAEKNLEARFAKQGILLSSHTYRLSLHLHDVNKRLIVVYCYDKIKSDI